MADQLGKLRARLEADSAGFSSGIAACKSSLKGFQGFANNALGSIKGMMGGLAGAIAGIGFGAAIKGSLDQLDRIDELSSTFGIATADLQKLDLVATQSGVEMDKLGAATAKLYKQLAENPDVFGSIGLSADTLVNLDLPGKLGMIGDALNRIESDEQRVAAAMQIFGKSGADLLPLLQNGMEGIAKAAAEVQSMGGIFSDEDIKKAVEANDALDRAAKSLKTITTDLAVTFAPTIEAIASAVGGLSCAFQTIQGWSGAAGRWIGKGVEAVMDTGYDANRAVNAASDRYFRNTTDANGNDQTRYFQRIAESTESMATNSQAAGLSY